MMLDYLKHRKSLVSKGKKSAVSAPSSSSSSVVPSASLSVSSVAPTPSLASIADDAKIKEYVRSVLASFFSQPANQVSLGTNPFISAPAEVPNESPQSRGPIWGREADNLFRGRHFGPSGMVPPSYQEDGIPPLMCLCLNLQLVIL